MTAAQWLTILAGIAAIVWVNWYFFFAERRATGATEGTGGVQEATITIRGGYEPTTVRVARGRPVRLRFDRQETGSCSEEVVLGDFGIRRFLPPFQSTDVEFTPATAGRFGFTCGMGMLHGTLIVE